MGNRNGFTLVELMFVTAILGILALLAAGRLEVARERAMNATAQNEVRHVAQAVDIYMGLHNAWPDDIDDLDYNRDPNVAFCRFELTAATETASTHVKLEASHRKSNKHITYHYPEWGSGLDDVDAASPCTD